MKNKKQKFVDLFCGLSGFRLAVENLYPNSECVFSCDFDLDSQKSYEANFGEKPFGDIKNIKQCENLPEIR